MRDSGTPFDANAVEAALDQLRYAQFEIIEETMGSRVPQRPDPEGNGQAFSFGCLRRRRAGRRNRRIEDGSESDLHGLAASETDGPLLCVLHVAAPWSRWMNPTMFWCFSASAKAASRAAREVPPPAATSDQYTPSSLSNGR